MIRRRGIRFAGCVGLSCESSIEGRNALNKISCLRFAGSHADASPFAAGWM